MSNTRSSVIASKNSAREKLKSKYDAALQAMVTNPTCENITEFKIANRELIAIEDECRYALRQAIDLASVSTR